jgi:hypothetical protein
MLYFRLYSNKNFNLFSTKQILNNFTKFVKLSKNPIKLGYVEIRTITLIIDRLHKRYLTAWAC